MKLSIIIVNYNVCYFLEQCLKSVYKALDSIEAEVFVVDNNSADQSVEMVKAQFPEVKLIANEDNPGFAIANNQAIRQAAGEYILLLNPDTVVEESTFSKSLAFMEAHPDAGGLGIKMIDGKGNFLPESKRGLPTPWVAFYKIFGLSSLFPKSKRFARYHLGHLSADENQEVEILAGAYMLMPKKVLDEIGLLDESFFMYGEDVDLSYRITQAGYKNYYLAESSIIHYKGESTKKGSLNYVMVFYKAMIIFAEKHFSGSYAKFFSFLIHLAIYLRAFMAVLARIAKKIAAPILDTLILYGGFFYIKEYWEHNHRFIQGGEYPPELMQFAVPAYILIWLLALYFNGAYDRQPRLMQLLRGIGIGTLAILVAYSLIPEDYRFSRALIILGALWAALALISWRYLWSRLRGKAVFGSREKERRILLIGNSAELERVDRLLAQTSNAAMHRSWVSVERSEDHRFIGALDDLADLVSVFEIDEVVFCAADLSAERIFKAMGDLQASEVEIKIAPSESQFIIGSNSIHSQGSWYTQDFNAINKAENKRAKRMFDLLSALVFLLLSPFAMWFSAKPIEFIKACLQVIFGLKTWVAYGPLKESQHLPELKPGVLNLALSLKESLRNDRRVAQLNQLYAKDYHWQSDLHFILQYWRKIGA